MLRLWSWILFTLWFKNTFSMAKSSIDCVMRIVSMSVHFLLHSRWCSGNFRRSEYSENTVKISSSSTIFCLNMLFLRYIGVIQRRCELSNMFMCKRQSKESMNHEISSTQDTVMQFYTWSLNVLCHMYACRFSVSGTHMYHGVFFFAF